MKIEIIESPLTVGRWGTCSEALITEVDEMLPRVTNMEARATVEVEELDQYMPMALEPAMNRPMAVIQLQFN